ncbi:MAG: hypothetical protein CXZ00_15705 [Acidobacteria bacterium]|nr:MAG: hypothetical protein CXZ00_15705 [Acidobacteriota bacterium]
MPGKSRFLNEYLSWDLWDIVVVGHQFDEERSGYQTEHTYEEVVAHKGEKFVRLWLHETRENGPRGGIDVEQHSESEITEEEYLQASSGKPLEDTEEDRCNFGKAKAEERRRAELYSRLLAQAPLCPSDDRRMRPMEGKFGVFWACPRSNCRKTQGMTAKEKRLYNGRE